VKDEILLSIRDLKTYVYANNMCIRAVDGVSLDIKNGKTLGIVGESGCGKSMLASSIMQLLPVMARIEQGSIVYHSNGQSINIEKLDAKGKGIRNLRGGKISMIFQNPMTSLTPVYKIGRQIIEMILCHQDMSKKNAKKRAVELLGNMGIASPEQRVKEYPHQFSGGMKQRAMIAMAIACSPDLLIADEPTTALDVTVQAQILELMKNMQKEYGMSIMMITHDLGVIAEIADDVAVMYMGKIVELGSVKDIIEQPKHPYTKALLKSIPILGNVSKRKLQPIRGRTPSNYRIHEGCAFLPRCDFCNKKCSQEPIEFMVKSDHMVKCWLYDNKKVN